MEISVIIPVYNAGSFVTQAVESALQQPETTEILLIEDGSPDNSWEVCQTLARKFTKVRLFRHDCGRNRGAGASRNLGMKNATCEFIAFLDADDYYLPGRFTLAKRIFEENVDCEGIYEAIGSHIENNEGIKRWKEANLPDKQLHTISKYVKPEDLFETLVEWRYGDFSIDGLTLKRNVVEKSGYMNEALRLHQDTDFIRKIAVVARLLPGRLDEPVAIWRVHARNRISAPRSEARVYKDHMKMWMSTYRWCKKNDHKEKQQLIFEYTLRECIRSKPLNIGTSKKIPTSIQKKLKLFLWLFEYPEVALERIYWKKLMPKTISKLSKIDQAK